MQPSADALESAEGLSDHTNRSVSSSDSGGKRDKIRETRAGCNHSSLKWLLVSVFYFWQLSKSLRHINAFEFINLGNCFSIDRTLVKLMFRLLTEESVFLFPHKYSGMFATSNQSHFGDDVKLTVSRLALWQIYCPDLGVCRVWLMLQMLTAISLFLFY